MARGEGYGRATPGVRSRPTNFLETVRSETSYSTLRKVVDFLTVLTIILCSIGILVQLNRGEAVESVLNMLILVLCIILTIAGKQATILFVDIADILIWNGKRQVRDEK